MRAFSMLGEYLADSLSPTELANTRDVQGRTRLNAHK